MLRPLLLAMLAGVLLCVLGGMTPDPVIADTSAVHSDTPKQPQMEVPPAVPSPTASQLQTTHGFLHKVENAVVPVDLHAGSTTPPVIQTLRAIQASTILRI
jgi:hypothetical protein